MGQQATGCLIKLAFGGSGNLPKIILCMYLTDGLSAISLECRTLQTALSLMTYTGPKFNETDRYAEAAPKPVALSVRCWHVSETCQRPGAERWMHDSRFGR
jgi:hypothetical protein